MFCGCCVQTEVRELICTHLPCLFWLQFQYVAIILGAITAVIICFDLGISKQQPNISKLSLILHLGKVRQSWQIHSDCCRCLSLVLIQKRTLPPRIPPGPPQPSIATSYIFLRNKILPPYD